MEELIKNIVGNRISKVVYYEMNNHERSFDFEEFHCIDSGVNIEMSNGFSWHFGWSEKMHHELKSGWNTFSDYNPGELKDFNVTHIWNDSQKSSVKEFNFYQKDASSNICSDCEIIFEDGRSIHIISATEITENGSLPKPFQFDSAGWIYIFLERDLVPITYYTEFKDSRENYKIK